MCDPITAAATAMQVGGAFENFSAGRRSQKAIKRSIKDESDSRRAMTEASNREFQISSDRVNPAEVLAAQRARSRGYAAATPTVTPGSFSPVLGPDSPAIAQRGAVQRASAIGREGARLAAGRGNLEGVGDFLFDQSVRHGRSMETIGTMSDFIRANQALLQMKLEAAKAKAKSPVGDALMMGGQILSGFGGVGGGGSGPTNIVPEAMGRPRPVPVGQPFVPLNYGFTPDLFRGIY
jgi:hypothetical protein